MQSKVSLREHFRKIRALKSADDRNNAAKAAAFLFAQTTYFNNSQHIACYLPYQDEFDTSHLLKILWRAKKNIYLPVLTKEAQKTLVFVEYHEGDPLHANRYHILEPENITHVISPDALDLVIMPLIAFDKSGHRLGTGGGYYDRTFAFLRQQKNAKLHLMGLAYAEQEAEIIPSDVWDIRMNGVITEKEIMSCPLL